MLNYPSIVGQDLLDAGRRMAEDREAFMQTFLDQFMRENGVG